MPDRDWPLKAYKNPQFLNSPAARPVRVLCELLEPQERFLKHNVHHTVVFFGSARTLPMAEAKQRLAQLEANEAGVGPEHAAALERARNDVTMARYYEDAARLSEKLTRWSLSLPEDKRFFICSGGGPGIMEAANHGALEAGGKTVALNISLPMEQAPNDFQTHDLAFEFHYFFIRKFWFVNLARALVVFPGGFGTCDELFELLTLVQTRKTEHYRSIVIYGTEFWKEVLNFDAFAKWGMIHPDDVKIFHFFDDVDSTFAFLKEELTKTIVEEKNGDPRPKGVPREPVE